MTKFSEDLDRFAHDVGVPTSPPDVAVEAGGVMVFHIDEPACSDPKCQRGQHTTGMHMSRSWDSSNQMEIVDEWGFVTYIVEVKS